MISKFDKIIYEMEPISLEDMGKVKLMNRIDSKYLTTKNIISDLLEIAAEDYFIQQIGEERNMPYATSYFDTSDNSMFYDHQRGKKHRQKIRIRKYEGNDSLSFLEIKKKNNKGRTKKKRLEILEGETIELYKEFIEKNSEFSPDYLKQKIDNHFYRLTLVNKNFTERITIDTDLCFFNLMNSKSFSYGDLSIIEWKRGGLSQGSVLKNLLRELRIHETGFSKYCIGMAITDRDLKQNKLKPKLRLASRISGLPLPEKEIID